MGHDWYLAYQLVDLTRTSLIRKEILTYVGLYDPSTGTHELFGHHTYSIGMLIFSPDSILFPLFSIDQAIIFHVLVTVLFVCYLLNVQLKKYSLSSFSRYFLVMNVIFSVPIMARLSEGHLQLLGYFLIPSFILLVNDINTGKDSKFWVIKVTLLLTYIISLGSTHVFFQMSLLLCIAGLFHLHVFFKFLIPPVFALLLTGFQSIPSLFVPYFDFKREVGPGYGYQFNENILGKDPYYRFDSVSNLLNTMLQHSIEIMNHLFLAIFENDFAILKNGWEWSLYIPPINILLLTMLIVYKRTIVQHIIKNNLYLFVSFVMSISLFYHFLWALVPFQAIDRVPYRMMLYPFFAILLIVTVQLDYLTSLMATKYLKNLSKCFILFSSSFSLIHSSLNWFKRTEESRTFPVLQDERIVPRLQIYMNEISPEYDRFLNLGFVITFLSWIIFLLFIALLSKKVRDNLETKSL